MEARGEQADQRFPRIRRRRDGASALTHAHFWWAPGFVDGRSAQWFGRGDVECFTCHFIYTNVNYIIFLEAEYIPIKWAAVN